MGTSGLSLRSYGYHMPGLIERKYAVLTVGGITQVVMVLLSFSF
jgi:hypothetical protein